MRICATHVRSKLEETSAVVTSRLMKIQNFQAAAEIYKSLNDLKVKKQSCCTFDASLMINGAAVGCCKVLVFWWKVRGS